MKLETTRFGVLDLEEDSIITFTQPILGFQEFRRFVLVPGGSDKDLKWLQSVDSGELAFILMDPRTVMPNYKVDLRSQELSELAVNSVDELEVHTLVVVPQNPAEIRTNLRAPILINLKQRLAKQTILERSDYPVRFFLAQAQGAEESAQEVANARTDA